MKIYKQSSKLTDVCYDIRGPALKEAKRLEEEGYHVMRLNIGNPAAFGFETPDAIVHDIITNIRNAEGYADSQGLFQARKAIVHDWQIKGLMGVSVEDIFIGNGVSELIMMAMHGLLDSGDEILVPAPDYPLWTAAITLAGGKAVHYICDEQSDWHPDLNDMRSKITPNTKGIVVINPNNPTGAVYERTSLESIAAIAAEHELIVFSDEIYGRITYEDARFIPFALLNPEILTVSFDGISKAYRAAGFRAGWMTMSGNKRSAAGYLEGLEMLSNMRICANVPAQYGIQTALGGYQSINNLILPGGRLKEQRDATVACINNIPGLSVVAPKGALYCFPKLDLNRFNIHDDERLILDILKEQKILVVQGTGFNWIAPDHFRIVFLASTAILTGALRRIGTFLEHYKQL
ncbi:MAG: pyridoxal phosphate-dependent aminotransferase [Spirochaetaceae bacterium]|jgi:alanine-synthesizing transaminase|nr:pyridoxal phosphate-dependent aminotransferase [Spirochaetaceae bacterium]